jgi:hypothetical protein
MAISLTLSGLTLPELTALVKLAPKYELPELKVMSPMYIQGIDEHLKLISGKYRRYTWHGHVQSSVSALHSRMCSRPIALNKSLESQLTFKQLINGIITFTSIVSIDLIVRAHNRCYASFNRSCKWPKIDLLQRAFINISRVLNMK